ncbi:Hypothetical protein A7982_06703 [Minicystis rosea]|nr:Hypothetical protein A7982_06703 [Minicystis rosea]
MCSPKSRLGLAAARRDRLLGRVRVLLAVAPTHRVASYPSLDASR